MSITLFQVDAFTSRPYSGNPAAVCVLDAAAGEAWMQNVALEMNLSETAFLVRQDDGAYRLRWFTPACEVELCGHATLASAHVLYEQGHLQAEEDARFDTLSGRLSARRNIDFIEMDFPAHPPTECPPPAGMLEALGVASKHAEYIGRNHLDYFIVLPGREALLEIAPDFRALKAIKGRGFIVTAPDDTSELDFISRYFAPAYGVDEDPVTGSAHCCLGPFWSDRLGKPTVTGYQASKRGGTVRVTTKGDRVIIAGQAVTVMKAELTG